MKPRSRLFTPLARDQVRRLPPSAKAAVRLLTDVLLTNPESGKALKEELAGYRSVRHNRYRIIYEFCPARRELVIHYVGLRASVYEEFTRLRKITAALRP